EEQCHACQAKHPKLAKQMAEEIARLVEAGAYEPKSYSGGDPRESHAGLMGLRALEAYRARKISM
ncbi:MAG: hypothetical protein K2Q01_03575, partial [Rickettsiales bacterium]|nr:hypothetical protein [Rickettsiales bacterium]